MNLSNARDHKILNDLYIDSCGALLSAYGLKVNVQERCGGINARNKTKTSYVSILSACGDGLRLSSMLKIDRNLVINTHPSGCANISQSDLEDWCLELNNQLVGRVKNKLIAYGHILSVGLPVLLTGTDISGVAAQNSEVHEYSVESADGQIILTLATFVAPDAELREMEPSTNDEAVLVEGAVSLF